MSRPAFECSNPECSNPVKPRRPSKTGNHWCPEAACQAMKQRQLRAARRNESLGRGGVEDERMKLVHAALHLPRRKCDECGLEDAVNGFLHRAAPGAREICEGTGGGGRAAGPAWIDLIHPDRANAGSDQ